VLTCETVSFVEQLVRNHDSFVAADKLNVVVFDEIRLSQITPSFTVRIVSLLRPRERWRSIVMSTSVCVSVCLSVCLSVREHISGDTPAIFAKFFVHVAYGRGSVFLRQGNEIPRGRGNFGGFPPR